jgi:hypothetical protein
LIDWSNLVKENHLGIGNPKIALINATGNAQVKYYHIDSGRCRPGKDFVRYDQGKTQNTPDMDSGSFIPNVF